MYSRRSPSRSEFFKNDVIFLGDVPADILEEPTIPPGHTEGFHDAFARVWRGQMEDDGYNKLRERIFENQKRLGVIAKDSKLTPWPDDLLKPWDQLSAEEKKLFIRQVEVFAAYAAYNDHEIGRVIQAFEDLDRVR